MKGRMGGGCAGGVSVAPTALGVVADQNTQPFRAGLTFGLPAPSGPRGGDKASAVFSSQPVKAAKFVSAQPQGLRSGKTPKLGKAEAPHLGQSCGAAFASEPVSRILSRTIIPLGGVLLRRSSDLPGGFPPSRRTGIGTRVSAPGRHASAARVWPSDSLPIWSCSVWGLPCHRLYRRRGALLPHLFTLTPGDEAHGGIFSVALAVSEP